MNKTLKMTREMKIILIGLAGIFYSVFGYSLGHQWNTNEQIKLLRLPLPRFSMARIYQAGTPI